MNQHASALVAWAILMTTASCGLGQEPRLGDPTALPGSERGLLTGSLPVQPANQEDMDLRMTPIVRAVQSAQDSVVCVDLLPTVAPAAGRQRAVRPEGQGSGVILDAEGLVITNWHVVAPVAGGRPLILQVRLHDGRQFTASLLSSSPEHDLALLQMDLPTNESVQPARLGSSKSLMVGETLIAIGNPQGHAHTVTSGVLSAIDRQITVRTPDRRSRQYSGLLQTDAAINQGNSGGALLDITGRLIGINNAMAMGSENIGFAIPVDTMREVFEDVLLNSSNLASTFSNTVVGFRTQASDKGLIVASVDDGGPADVAGMLADDILTAVAGRDVRAPIDLARALAGIDADRSIPVEIQRQGAARTLQVVPMERGQWLVKKMVGVDVEILRGEGPRQRAAVTLFGRRASRPYEAVLKVTAVKEGGPGAKAGLEPGDLWLGVKAIRNNGWMRSVWTDVPVESTSQLHDRLQAAAGDTLPIIIQRDGKTLEGPIVVPRQRNR